MATHSSVLAWRISGTGKPVGCCLWGRIESDTTEGLSSSSSRTSQVAQTAKRLPIVRETWVRSLSREDPLEKWQPTPAFLPGKSHGWRSLVGYSPWGHKESDTTE